MIKTIRHVILEVLNNNEVSSDPWITSKSIVDLCMKNNPNFEANSIMSKISLLRKECLINSKESYENLGCLLNKISTRGLNVFESYNDLYNGKHNYNFHSHDFCSVDEAFYLNNIENYIYKENKWVFALDVNDFFNVPKEDSRVIVIKLNLLHKLGFLDKKRHENGNLMYKTKENRTVENMNKSDVSLLIEKYLYTGDTWITKDNIIKSLHLSVQYNSRIEKILKDLNKKRLIYIAQTSDDPCYVLESMKLHLKNADDDTDVVNLKMRVVKLLDLGVSHNTIGITCCEALNDYLKEEKEKKRRLEMEFLKEKDFLLLEDFEVMKSKLIKLKEEVGKE